MVHDDKGDVAALLQSKEGVRQGCVLGSFAFAVATLEMLTTIKENHKDIELVAYLDDVTPKATELSCAHEGHTSR